VDGTSSGRCTTAVSAFNSGTQSIGTYSIPSTFLSSNQTFTVHCTIGTHCSSSGMYVTFIVGEGGNTTSTTTTTTTTTTNSPTPSSAYGRLIPPDTSLFMIVTMILTSIYTIFI